jgi:hypothetical protein
MDDFKEKLKSLSFGSRRIVDVRSKETGSKVGEQMYHKDGTVSAYVMPEINVSPTVNRSGN